MSAEHAEQLEPGLEEEFITLIASTIPLQWPTWFVDLVEDALREHTAQAMPSYQKIYRAGIEAPRKAGETPNITLVVEIALLRRRLDKLTKTLGEHAWMAHTSYFEFNNDIKALRKALPDPPANKNRCSYRLKIDHRGVIVYPRVFTDKLGTITGPADLLSTRF